MQLTDRDGALHAEDAHAGDGAEPHEQHGPTELRGLPVPEDVQRHGEEEGEGDKVAAEVNGQVGELVDGLRGGIGQHVVPAQFQDRFEIGEEGEVIGPGRAQEFEEGQTERMAHGAPVVPNPRQQRQGEEGRRDQGHEPARAQGDDGEDPKAGENPQTDAVSEGDQAEEQGGEGDEEEGFDGMASGTGFQRRDQSQQGAVEEEQHGHLRQAGESEPPAQVEDEQQAGAEQGEARIKQAASQAVGEKEGAGEEKQTGEGDGAFRRKDCSARGEPEIHARRAQGHGIEQRSERGLTDVGHRDAEVAGAGQHEVHGQRTGVERGVALAAGELASDLRLVHRIGAGEAVEFREKPQGGNNDGERGHDQPADPDHGAALLEVVQEGLDGGLDGHGLRPCRVPGARAVCGGGCGG